MEQYGGNENSQYQIEMLVLMANIYNRTYKGYPFNVHHRSKSPPEIHEEKFVRRAAAAVEFDGFFL